MDMYYLTNYKFTELLNTLYLDLPLSYAEAYMFYYSKYRLASFDLDLSFFTADEARALTIADKLVKDIHIISKEVQIKKHEYNQKQWINSISLPAFHTNNECASLTHKFENVRIPESCEDSRRDEYREFFLESRHRYGYSENKADPTVFCRLLKARFNLSESIEELERDYFDEVNFDNSGVMAFNETLDFEKEMKDIQAKIDEFCKQKKGLTEKAVRSAYYRQKDKNLTQEEREMMRSVYQQRKEIYFRIINFYFKKLFKEGADIPEHILMLAGFQPCKGCCGHKY